VSDSPGWASPGSPPPQDGSDDGANSGPNDATPAGPPASPAPQGWQSPQPPGPPPPGWGGHPQPGGWEGGQQPGGWGGWHPQALAAKPGVIPLRPLGVGEILDGAVSTARAHWRTVLAIALGIAVVTQLISTVAMRVWVSDSSGLEALENNPNPTNDEIRDALGDLFAFFSVAGVVTLLGTVLATAMLTIVVSRAVLGRSVTMSEAWHDSRDRLPRLLGLVLLVTLLAVVAVGVPTLLAALTGSFALAVLAVLGGAVLAVWLWVRLSLAAPALMLERQGVMAAMRRSWKLVGGSWWRIFGILLLIQILVTIVAGIIEFPISIVAGIAAGQGADSFFSGSVSELSWTYLAISGIGAVVSSTITLPISAGVTALLYMDQRIRREALDLELARAAGVGGTPPATPGPPGAPGS
jgi:glycerophosphoryl diester phosphodiesterase family protein